MRNQYSDYLQGKLSSGIERLRKPDACIVFCVEHYNPLGVIRALGENGIKPTVVAVQGSEPKLASKSKYIGKLFEVSSIEEGYERLLKLAPAGGGAKPLVFTCDDKIASFLDARFGELKDRVLFFNAGVGGRIAKYMDKAEIGQLARKHGFDVLTYEVVDNGEPPKSLRYPVITKDVASTVGAWKDDVYICKNEGELMAAFAKISSPKVLVQEYLEKENEYCLEGLSVRQGGSALVAIASTYDYILADSYSPFMTVSPFLNTEVDKGLKGMLAEIGFEGIFEAEFLRGKDGSLYFGEINFRDSTWNYAANVAGMPLPVVWALGMTDPGFDVERCAVRDFEPFKAVVEPADFKQRVVKHHGGFLSWVSDIRKSKCTYYYNPSDKRPFFFMLTGKFGKLFHRVS